MSKLTPEQLHIARTLAGEYFRCVKQHEGKDGLFRYCTKQDAGLESWWWHDPNAREVWRMKPSNYNLPLSWIANDTVVEVNPQTGEDIPC